MKFSFEGSFEVRLKNPVVIEADDRDEAMYKLIESVNDGEVERVISDQYLKIKQETKKFKVTVTETFVHIIDIDTSKEDFADITSEEEAARYVEDNMYDIRDVLCLDYDDSENISAECSESDTEEYEEEIY